MNNLVSRKTLASIIVAGIVLFSLTEAYLCVMYPRIAAWSMIVALSIFILFMIGMFLYHIWCSIAYDDGPFCL